MPSLWITNHERELVALDSAGYASEADFQELLADSPELIASALGDDAWLLLSRELPISARTDEAGTWSLDHLFVSSDGRPVLVEVKRSSDARLRREVVGQMLDYASSFASEWTADALRAHRSSRQAEVEELDAFLAATDFDGEVELWDEVQTRIDARQLKLVFVADRIPETLRRIVEFLNADMHATEVLAVEIVRHASADGTQVAYEPVVHGRANPAAARKERRTRRSRDEFFELVKRTCRPTVTRALTELVSSVESLQYGYSTISTAKEPSLYLNLRTAEDAYWPLALKPNADKLIIVVKRMATTAAFDTPDALEELLDRVASAVDADLMGNRNGRPWVPLSCVDSSEKVRRLLDVVDWIHDQVVSAST